VREARVQDLVHADQAGLLHHALRGAVGVEGEGDDGVDPRIVGRGFEGGAGELGREAAALSSGRDRVQELDPSSP